MKKRGAKEEGVNDPHGDPGECLEGSVTIPQKNTHASVVSYGWVAKGNHRNVRLLSLLKSATAAISGAVPQLRAESSASRREQTCRKSRRSKQRRPR